MNHHCFYQLVLSNTIVSFHFILESTVQHQGGYSFKKSHSAFLISEEKWFQRNYNDCKVCMLHFAPRISTHGLKFLLNPLPTSFLFKWNESLVPKEKLRRFTHWKTSGFDIMIHFPGTAIIRVERGVIFIVKIILVCVVLPGWPSLIHFSFFWTLASATLIWTEFVENQKYCQELSKKGISY